MSRPLFTPPQLHLPDQGNERHATWLELFYDLVFAVAISALSTHLLEKPTFLTTAQTAFLFIPVWWAWVGHTVYDTRFDTDDIFQRLCTFGMMLAAAFMAATIPQAFTSQAALFAGGYISARIWLLLLYTRVYWHVREARPITRIYLSGFSIGAGLWIVSLFLPSPWIYTLWLVAMCIELVTPWLGQHLMRQAPLDTTLFPERFASFTIIVLGLLIAVIVSRVSHPDVALASYIAALLTFAIVICIWWLYFTFLRVAPVETTLGPGQPFIYTHLPLILGLILLSVALSQSIDEATRPTLSPTTCWFFACGLVIWSLSGLILKLVMTHVYTAGWILARLGVLVCLVLLICAGTVLPPLLTLGLLFTGLAIFTALEVLHIQGMMAAGVNPF